MSSDLIQCRGILVGCLSLLWLLSAVQGYAQDAIRRGGRPSFGPQGPGVLFDALDPAVRKWHVPQELYVDYGWRPQQYTNYARTNYQRYVFTSTEGFYTYDFFGNFLTRGWLIFDWRQINPRPFGSTLFKDQRFGQWFNSVVVASDRKGQYRYAITVGDEIRTTLTPMTFSKPRFNGVQIDIGSDRYEGTLLLSRINEPDPFIDFGFIPRPADRSDNTHLRAARIEAQVGDFVKIGGTWVNARHSRTLNDATGDDFFKGQLVGAQILENLSFIEMRIGDDSPGDGTGGGTLFDVDIRIWDLEGNESRGSEIGFRPLIDGGFQRRGYLAADGGEQILVRYDLLAPEYSGPHPAQISRIQLELVVANDYLVEISSDLHLNLFGQQVFVPIARAEGNTVDSSNQQVLAFDYGLPTANQIVGFTFELTDLEGFTGHFELNINDRWRQFPNRALSRHHTRSERSLAWMALVSHISHPYFANVEAFSVAPGYQTSFRTVQEHGIVDYGDDFKIYEFVDDNDDQDRFPDWRRKGFTAGDAVVFPGWDENNDFISDYNQNDNENSPNRFPDYEEPFLRFHTDRPEFLYGIDMNHNGTVDRFENDEEADLPYERDRQGYNVYAGRYLHPDLKMTLGQQRVRQIADKRRNLAHYFLLSGDHTVGRLRLRLFQDLRKVQDRIRNDLLQWVQPPNSRGELQPVHDVLPAQNTVVNTTWLGLDYEGVAGMEVKNILRWQLYRQLDSGKQLALRSLTDQTSFFGLVNKVECRLDAGPVVLIPAGKSEFLRFSSFDANGFLRREWGVLGLLIARKPLLSSTRIEIGVEYYKFVQLQDPTPPGAADGFTEWTALAQVTDTSDYQGYRLTTVLGFSLNRLALVVEDPFTTARGFLTVYAGVEP